MIDISVEYDDYMLPLNAKSIRKVFRDVVIEEGKEIQSLYKGLLSNFTPRNRSPIISKSGSGRSPTSGSSGSIYAAVGTNRIDGPLVWLEDGTSVRYRVMSSNWRSMTRPGGGLSVGAGRGIALGFGIRPGIGARNFRDDIVGRRYPELIKAGQIAFDSMFAKARWY